MPNWCANRLTVSRGQHTLPIFAAPVLVIVVGDARTHEVEEGPRERGPSSCSPAGVRAQLQPVFVPQSRHV